MCCPLRSPFLSYKVVYCFELAPKAFSWYQMPMIFAFGEKQEKEKEKVLNSKNWRDEMEITIHSLLFFFLFSFFLSADHKIVIANFVNKLNRVDLFAINTIVWKSICVINLLVWYILNFGILFNIFNLIWYLYT